MSRFFAASESDTDSDGSQSDGGVVGMGGATLDGFQENAAPTLAARFTFEDSDSEDERRVVKTQKQKRFEELQVTIKALKNHMKIRDFVKISSEFDNLQHQIDNPKLADVIKKEGVPRFYLKAVVFLQDFVEQAFGDKAARKKLSPSNAKSLSKLRQHLAKKNKLFQKELKEYRLNPDEDKAGSDSDRGSGDSDEDSGDESDDDSDVWDTDSSEGSDDEGGFSLDKDEVTRDFWVKKTSESDLKAKKVRKTKVVKVKKKASSDNERASQEVEWTPELIQKKLQEVFKARGRATFDKQQSLKDLQEMTLHAQSPAAKVAVMCALIGTLNDMNLNKNNYMNITRWKEGLEVITNIVEVLRATPELRLKELDEDEVKEEDLYDEAEEVDEFAQAEKAAAEAQAARGKKGKPVAGVAPVGDSQAKSGEVDESAGFETIKGNLYAFVVLLVREYRKSLQFLDFNEPAYAERQKDEVVLLEAIRKVREYYNFIGNKRGESRMCSLVLDHVYQAYDEKQDEVTQREEAQAQKESSSSQSGDGKLVDYLFHGPAAVLEPPQDEVQELCSFIYREGDSRSKTHALLQRVTHYAIHNRFAHARDLLLMSHLAESIANADVATKILFNRTQAFLALSAFRCGRYMLCMKILAEIYTTQRIKEILAQGVSSTRWNDRDMQQEAIERKRIYPNHLHLSLDLLESCHLVSAMLLEIPMLALNPTDDRKYQISRTFRRLYDGFLSDPFHGPPENTRDYILHASVALSKGKWKECNEYIMSLKMWSLVQNEEKVRAKLTTQIKESALQTYLLVYGSQYVTLSLPRLSTMFELDLRTTHRNVARMIATKDLNGSLDQPAQTLTVHLRSTGYLQKMALSYADKLNSFVDQNEKLLETVAGRSGAYAKRGEGGEDGGSRSSRGGGDKRSGGDKKKRFGDKRPGGDKRFGGDKRSGGGQRSGGDKPWHRGK